MSNKPTPAQISRVMAHLGRRNKGKRKTLSPAGIEQRRKAGKASAQLRKANAKRYANAIFKSAEALKHAFRNASPSPAAPRHTPENIAPLAQTK